MRSLSQRSSAFWLRVRGDSQAARIPCENRKTGRCDGIRLRARERLRTHLGISCIVLGVVLIVVAALLDPGGTMATSLMKETAAVVLTVVIYLVLRRQTRHRLRGHLP